MFQMAGWRCPASRACYKRDWTDGPGAGHDKRGKHSCRHRGRSLQGRINAMVRSEHTCPAVLCVIFAGLGAAALLTAAWPARAADKAPNQEALTDEARKLVGQLGDDSFSVREAASKRLMEIG